MEMLLVYGVDGFWVFGKALLLPESLNKVFPIMFWGLEKDDKSIGKFSTSRHGVIDLKGLTDVLIYNVTRTSIGKLCWDEDSLGS